MNDPGPTRKHPAASPVLHHPGRWLWLFLLVPVALGLMRLRFDVEVFDLLPTNLPSVEGLKLYQEHFANARELIVTLQARNGEEAEQAAHNLADRLRSAQELVETVTWEPPWLEHPEQSAELLGYLWFNQPPQAFEELEERLAPTNLNTLLEHAKEDLALSMSPQDIARLSYDPYGLTRLPEAASGAAPAFGQGQQLFSSPDGTFRILFVKARGELHTYRQCAQWLSSIRAIANSEIARLGLSGHIKLGYTGRPAFVAEVATGMEQDMTKSVGGTAVIIAVLFWLAHRRIKPMLWLLTLLGLILGSTLALGGLVFGTINVVSMGFAAILLGLAVDYAVVHYQEALAQPELTIPQIRHAIAPSIFWAAITTIAAFLVLNFGGLPGLGQLGTLVGLGVALAALIMIFEFLPPLFPGRDRANPQPRKDVATAAAGPSRESRSRVPVTPGPVFAATALLLLASIAVLAFGLPRIDSTAAALRPRHSEAYGTLERVQALLSQKREPLWVVVQGKSAEAVANRLREVHSVLQQAQTNAMLSGFNLPTALWPRPDFQKINRATARRLFQEGPLLRKAALTNDFAPQALALTEGILHTWAAAAAADQVFWPTNPMSQWILEKFAARTPTNFFALGLITPDPHVSSAKLSASLSHLQQALPESGVWISGWELLGSSIFERVKSHMWAVLLPMVGLVLLSLFMAFRRAAEIGLSLGVLILSGLCVLSVMRLAGWSWNLLNLMALPLVLGTGVDYSIFMQLALRRHNGDLLEAYNSVGRALLLCGGTAIAGFGSLAWSSNAGMASLGEVCAAGIASNMLIAIFLLPVWWRRLLVGNSAGPTQGSAPNSGPPAPSSLYRSHFWVVGLALVRILPGSIMTRTAQLFASIYWALASHRRKVVCQNLLPAVGDKAAAATTTRALFRQFARKVVHLWRFEGGSKIDHLLVRPAGWEHFQAAQARNRGVLLLTPHLGNWEFGGPMMTQRGVPLQVLTLAEPGRAFTKLREANRARWQIETLVVGNDPLAFVEIIKRLEAGATIALLMDRPPPASAVTVELFGRPFQASIAAAELARACGCALLPVYIPWEGDGYSAHMLPAISYDRAALRDRAARTALTQQILKAFEPIIRQHLDQWYHFVPVWGKEPQKPTVNCENRNKV